VEIRIDRLRLQVPGTNPDTARQLGRLLAEQLATMVAAAPPASGATRLTSLRVLVPGPAGQHPGSLAPAMATEISRALRTATTGTATAGTAATARTAATTGPGAAR
jgi:hypothetical protein